MAAQVTIWSRLGSLVQAAGTGGAHLVDRLVELILGDEAHRRSVAFTAAIVALSAKMARADGVVTDAEVAAFRGYVQVPAGDEAHVRRLFQLAQRDVAGFEYYAARISTLFADEPALKEDVLEGLFLIAAADGLIHESELAFLDRVSEILAIDRAAHACIRARHVAAGPRDPYVVLGIAHDASDGALRARYRDLVRQHHPDRFIARGVPPEFVRIANDRLAAINAAFGQISLERGI